VGEPYTLVLEFSRAKEAGNPFEFRMKPQVYNRRLADRTYRDAELEWDDDLVAAIESLRGHHDPEVIPRLGNTLRAFLERAGWGREEAALQAAIEAGRPVVLTIRSAAAELYALPWELLTLGQSMRHLGELPGVLLRYEWPGTSTQAERPSPRPEGGRVFFAYSHADGRVPMAEHLAAIKSGCQAGAVPFDEDRDVLGEASRKRLGEALAAAKRDGRPIAVLHLLCHGGPVGSTFGLMLDPDVPGDPAGVDADRLASLLAEHADMVRLVVIAACDGGNIGPLGNHMGSVAQAIHRAGIAAVVASRYPFSIEGANAFTRVLYRELLAPPRSVEDAFVRTRQHLAAIDSRFLDWASVQLYAREEDGVDARPVVIRPYQGLLPLGPSQSRFFFGREAEAAEIVSDLDALVTAKKPRFLVVQGWSGTGKSSMVMAGAVPRLVAGGYALATMKPGADPETALDLALGAQQKPRLLLVVDQLEEIFTHAPVAARDAFARRLWSLARAEDREVAVIVTVRSDFIGRCGEILLDDAGTRLDAVANAGEHSVRVSQLSRAQLREAIEAPAAKVGLALDLGLADRILREIGTALGALPLIAHTMHLLWLARAGRALTMNAYDGIGRVTGALHQHANGIIDGLDAEGQKMAERLFVALVGHDADRDVTAPDTRRRLPVEEIRGELCQGEAARERAFDAMVGALEGGRLLVTEGEGHRRTVEVAHEALLRGWARLDGWVERHGDLLRRKKEIDRLLATFATHGALLNDRQIGVVQAFQKDYPEAFSKVAAELLHKSLARVARARLGQRIVVAVSVVTALVIGALGAVAWSAKKDAQFKEGVAVVAQVKAEASALRAKDATLIAAAEGRVAHNDPVSAIELLRAVTQKDQHSDWLRLTLDTLRAAPARELPVHTKAARKAAWSPDDEWVVTGSDDSTAHVFNVRDPRQQRSFEGHTGAVTSVAWAREGRWIATGSADGTARVWNADQPDDKMVLTGHHAALTRVRFGADNTVLTVDVNGGAALWYDVLPTRERMMGPAAAPRPIGKVPLGAAMFSANGKGLFTASRTGIVGIWETETLRERFHFDAGQGPLKGLDLASDPPAILTVGANESLRVWKLDTGQPTLAMELALPFPDESVTAWKLTPNGEMFFAGYSGGAVVAKKGAAAAELRARRSEDDETGSLRAHTGPVVSVLYKPATWDALDTVVTLAQDGTARVWSVVDGVLTDAATMRYTRPLLVGALATDGKSFVTGAEDGVVHVWNTSHQTTQPAPRVLASVTPGQRQVRGVGLISLETMREMSADRRAYGLVLPLEDDNGDVAFPLKDAALQRADVAPVPLRAAVLTEDGPDPAARKSVIAGVKVSGEVLVWRDATRDRPLVLPVRQKDGDVPDLSRDGASILVLTKEGQAQLFSTTTASSPRVFAAPAGVLVHAALSPDGQRVLAGTSDGTALRWRVDAPDKPETLRDPGDAARPVASVAFDDSGAQALVVSDRGVARLWGEGPQKGACLRDAALGGRCDEINAKRARLSVDGKWVVAVTTDKQGAQRAALWSVAALDKPVRLGPAGARSIAFDRASKRVATGSADRRVRVFRLDATEERLQSELRAHSRPVDSVEWSPDSQGLITAVQGGDTRFWHIDETRLAQALLERLNRCLSVPQWKVYLDGLEGMGVDPEALRRSCEAEHGQAMTRDAQRAAGAAPVVASAVPAVASAVPAVASAVPVVASALPAVASAVPAVAAPGKAAPPGKAPPGKALPGKTAPGSAPPPPAPPAPPAGNPPPPAPPGPSE
jgi:WD40 repeat protein